METRLGSSEEVAEGPYDTDLSEAPMNSLHEGPLGPEREIPVGPEKIPEGPEEVPVGPRTAAILSKTRRRPPVEPPQEESEDAVSVKKQPDVLLPQALPLTASVGSSIHTFIPTTDNLLRRYVTL